MLRRLKQLWRVIVGTAKRFDDDNGGFLASALAFDLLLCVLPFIIIIISVIGHLLESSQYAQQEIIKFFERVLPGSMEEVQENLGRFVRNRRIVGALGLASLVFTASRVFSSIRFILKTVFRSKDDMHFVVGKLLDIGFVVFAGALALLSIGLSSFFTVWEEWGNNLLQNYGWNLEFLRNLVGYLIAYLVTITMFFLLYRMPLLEAVPAKVVWIQAIVVGTLWEGAKMLFELYLNSFNQYSIVYGSLGFLVALILWFYYTALIIVIGAELGSTIHDLQHSRARS